MLLFFSSRLETLLDSPSSLKDNFFFFFFFFFSEEEDDMKASLESASRPHLELMKHLSS
jgi:hypothetical protein